MKPKKHKESKILRWELKHAAGCTEPLCSTKWMLRAEKITDYLQEYKLTKPVSVPKSLRHILGRYVKGN